MIGSSRSRLWRSRAAAEPAATTSAASAATRGQEDASSLQPARDPQPQRSGNVFFRNTYLPFGAWPRSPPSSPPPLLPGFTPSGTGPTGGQVLERRLPGRPAAGLRLSAAGFDPAVRYPVVYLLHGIRGSPEEYLDGTELAGFADRRSPTAGCARSSPSCRPQGRPRLQRRVGGTVGARAGRAVDWMDAQLPTIASARGRVIAGLSAGGFGAIDIGLRHPSVFGRDRVVERLLPAAARRAVQARVAPLLAANDPTRLVRSEARLLAREHTRFFVSSGPGAQPLVPAVRVASTFARELRSLGLPAELRLFPDRKGEWREQLDAGLGWAFPG